MGGNVSLFDPLGIIPDDFNPLDPFGLFNIEFNPLDPMANIEPYKYHLMFVFSIIIGIIIYRKFIMLTPAQKMRKQMLEAQQVQFASPLPQSQYMQQEPSQYMQQESPGQAYY